MKKTIKWTVAILLLVAGFAALIANNPIVRSLLRVQRQSMRMCAPETYEQSAYQLALLCQSMKFDLHTYLTGTAWLPEPLRNLRPSYGSITSSEARIEMGGGHYHYGYMVVRNASGSNGAENCWDLFFYDENSKKHLCSVVLPVEQHYAVDDLTALAMSGFDEAITATPQDIVSYQRKFHFLILFDQRELARSVCRQAMEDMPYHWWPRLTAALMESDDKSVVSGTDPFTKWIEANPSFPHYVYLSYFNHTLGKCDAVCSAVAMAASYPLEVESTDQNAYSLAYSACLYAFRCGCYTTAVEMAMRLQPDGSSPNPFYYGAMGIRAAAHFMLGDEEQANSLLNDIPSRSSEELGQIDLEMPPKLDELKAAVANHNASAVAHWADSINNGFNPYERLPIDKIRGISETQKIP